MSGPRAASPSAVAIIRRLGLAAHPEGGHFRETWCDPAADGQRGGGTAIYWRGLALAPHRRGGDLAFLCRRSTRIAHRRSRPSDRRAYARPDIERGERPQAIVAKGAWQSARPAPWHDAIGWSLVGCTVSPAFDFTGFKLAPEGW